MVYIIGIVLVIAVLLVIGYFVKKKYYSEIDRLEAWKIDVMNRPVLDEVGKIKHLNMSGQAEEYFENWRKMWDAIVTEDLPTVEEWLFDAEEHVDKFRFKRAKEIFAEIESILSRSEKKIDEMVVHINEIIESDEKNREEILDLQELYKNLKKNLLAHRHSFGNAARKLELLMGEMEDQFLLYNEETSNGNYLSARKVVQSLSESMEVLKEKIEKIPLLINECTQQIPNQLKEIKDGIREMKEEGYFFEHLGIEKEIERMEGQLKAYIEFIENTEIGEVESGLSEMKEQLEVFYELLVKEVNSKQFVKENSPVVKKSLDHLHEVIKDLSREAETVKLSYQLSDSDLEMLDEMKSKMGLMKQTVQVLLSEQKDGPVAYSVIKAQLEELINEIAEIEQKQESFSAMLHTLRKDELYARDKIVELKRQINEANRIVTRSNVPGIPADIDAQFFEAGEALQDTIRYLEQKPLSMPAVNMALEKAESAVSALIKNVTEMVENVYFIERIIQYGNRYRRINENLNQRLKEAEMAFRQYDYQRALEEAASAVEAVEPGALKRIEGLLNEEMKE